jgi:hypothetical protein
MINCGELESILKQLQKYPEWLPDLVLAVAKFGDGNLSLCLNWLDAVDRFIEWGQYSN